MPWILTSPFPAPTPGRKLTNKHGFLLLFFHYLVLDLLVCWKRHWRAMWESSRWGCVPWRALLQPVGLVLIHPLLLWGGWMPELVQWNFRSVSTGGTVVRYYNHTGISISRWSPLLLPPNKTTTTTSNSSSNDVFVYPSMYGYGCLVWQLVCILSFLVCVHK